MRTEWPRLDYLAWRETCSALHLYLQIAGKYRLAHTPWLNHSWNATFYVTPTGLASSPIPDGPGIEILFDFREHKVVGTCGNGHRASFDLGPTTVASFRADFVALITELGGTPSFNDTPNEVPDPVPFSEDYRDRPYDREAVHRYHQALVAMDRVSRPTRPRPTSADGTAIFWNVTMGARAKCASLRPHRVQQRRLRPPPRMARSSARMVHRRGAIGLSSTVSRPR
ncbi:MAG: DUF5996 family protein [Roseovarius sp.]